MYVKGNTLKQVLDNRIQSQCTCEHCWEYRTLLIQFCGNNKQVVKGIHCQCNVNTINTSWKYNILPLTSSGIDTQTTQVVKCSLLEIQYFTMKQAV